MSAERLEVYRKARAVGGYDLLSLFAAHEELEGEPAQEWSAGALGPLNSFVPDGVGDVLRGYEDVLFGAHECMVDEVCRAATLDELRDQDQKQCVPGSPQAGYFTKPVLREHEVLGNVFTVSKGEAAPPAPPPELQAPIRSVAAARRTGE